ncbi:MAG: hypothetical protein SFV53_07050 [Rickettsiales bacterium]|nr:hypothetical protein [Rickettsiales bacterium]
MNNAKLSFAQLNGATPQAEINSIEAKFEDQQKARMSFLKSLKVGQKVNGWLVEKINYNDEPKLISDVTLKGNIKAKVKYYFDVQPQWYEGLDYESILTLSFAPQHKKMLPVADLSRASLEKAKGFLAISDGSYGEMEVEIGEIFLLGYCQCDSKSDLLFINRITNFKEKGRVKSDNEEEYKIQEQRAIDFLQN